MRSIPRWKQIRAKGSIRLALLKGSKASVDSSCCTGQKGPPSCLRATPQIRGGGNRTHEQVIAGPAQNLALYLPPPPPPSPPCKRSGGAQSPSAGFRAQPDRLRARPFQTNHVPASLVWAALYTELRERLGAGVGSSLPVNPLAPYTGGARLSDKEQPRQQQQQRRRRFLKEGILPLRVCS